MRKIGFLAGVLLLGLIITLPLGCTRGAHVPRLDPQTLKGWLSDPRVIVLDVRAPHDWQTSSIIIKGAVRVDPYDVKTWAALLPHDKKIVLYCA